jgi:dTDP-4-amino-4,6-dideoxygalactose transaminase
MSNQSAKRTKLAMHGGEPAKTRPDPPMHPGGMMIDQKEEEAVLEVLRSKRLHRWSGPNPGPSKVTELEQAFAARTGMRHTLAVTSGTASLICGLHGLGVGAGDEVIVPAYTWIASAAAVLDVGGVPVVAEVDETLTLDPEDVETKITSYTKAIMPVHMRGAPCQMDALMAVAERHGLQVIEDTAQANGASYKGRYVGTFGDVGCFSLQWNKIITSGEGGMVVTDDKGIWKRAFMYHDVIGPFRQEIPDDEIMWGINFRMPELLAAVLLVQLKRLDGLIDAMRTRKRLLKAGIEGVAARKGVQFQESHDPAGDAAVALIFFVDSPERAAAVCEALKAENIGAMVLYDPDRKDYHVYPHWTPIVKRRPWSEGSDPWRSAHCEVRYSVDDCPRSLDLLGRSVHLDVSPLLTNEDVEETVEGVNRVLEALL